MSPNDIKIEDLPALLRREFTFIPYFKRLDLKEQQEEYFIRRGVDDGVRFKADTALARAKRWGYYRADPRPEAGALGPYGVWTGNTLAHTHGEKGRVSIRTHTMTIEHSLNRKITNYWDEKALDQWLDQTLDDHFQDVFDGKPTTSRLAA
ncbi:MAG: hypothetical protein E6Q97_06070 [Desulfurellales bacterium]|nr:MAG: hypothetical protein E6Q97_06070 [Desulfurellales bacterium]